MLKSVGLALWCSTLSHFIWLQYLRLRIESWAPCFWSNFLLTSPMWETGMELWALCCGLYQPWNLRLLMDLSLSLTLSFFLLFQLNKPIIIEWHVCPEFLHAWSQLLPLSWKQHWAGYEIYSLLQACIDVVPCLWVLNAILILSAICILIVEQCGLNFNIEQSGILQKKKKETFLKGTKLLYGQRCFTFETISLLLFFLHDKLGIIYLSHTFLSSELCGHSPVIFWLQMFLIGMASRLPVPWCGSWGPEEIFLSPWSLRTWPGKCLSVNHSS